MLPLLAVPPMCHAYVPPKVQHASAVCVNRKRIYVAKRSAAQKPARVVTAQCSGMPAAT